MNLGDYAGDGLRHKDCNETQSFVFYCINMRRDMIRNYSSKEIYEDDGVIYVNGIAIGAVSPTVLFGKKKRGLVYKFKKGDLWF